MWVVVVGGQHGHVRSFISGLMFTDCDEKLVMMRTRKMVLMRMRSNERE